MVTEPGGILENRIVFSIVDKVVSVFRAIPFIILLAFIAPFTQLIVGTQIGTTAALVPLSLGVMDEHRAMNQDIRPLKIGILNLMPLKEDTELQLLRSLSNTPLQVDVSFKIGRAHV